MKSWHDLETYSPVPITNGAHAYAEQAEILLWAYALEDGPVSVWDVTAQPLIPTDLLRILTSDSEFWWQNGGMFDRVILANVMPDLYERMTRDNWRDTMVQALCHGLPGKLDTLSEIFKLPPEFAKDKRGKQLIQIFCKPQPKNQKLRRKTRETHPEEWAEFIEYAKSDIRSMRILHNKMPKWNYPNNKTELDLWLLDQEMNMGGIYVDTDLAEKAIEAVDKAQASLAAQTVDHTDGEVQTANQRDKLLAYILAEHGVNLPDMKADTLERRLSDASLPDAVRDLIHIRLQASTSSVSKYKRLIKGVSSDGYLRGTLQFCGAGRTGRDAGRLFQPQNMMRPTLTQADIDNGIEAIKLSCADLITDNVMELCANAVRGSIIAPPGQKLVVSDLANIEGRGAAWLAGEEWKLQAFRDYDAGTGPDPYVKAYAEAFRVPYGSVDKKKRQIGKVMELMLAYAGGVGAFITGAATYGIDLDDLTEAVIATIPKRIWADASGFLDWAKETKRPLYGLSDDAFRVCDSLKRMWRETNPKISELWQQLDNAAVRAIHQPGLEFSAGMCVFRREGNWLRIILPSGRSLSYPSPRVDESGAITYMGVNQYTRKWSRIKTYGGKLLENICQAFARDVLMYNCPCVVEAGYRIPLRVHDELLTYAPDSDSYGEERLSALITHPHEWAPDLPLAAAGFEGYRYRKD